MNMRKFIAIVIFAVAMFLFGRLIGIHEATTADGYLNGDTFVLEVNGDLYEWEVKGE